MKLTANRINIANKSYYFCSFYRFIIRYTPIKETILSIFTLFDIILPRNAQSINWVKIGPKEFIVKTVDDCNFFADHIRPIWWIAIHTDLIIICLKSFPVTVKVIFLWKAIINISIVENVPLISNAIPMGICMCTTNIKVPKNKSAEKKLINKAPFYFPIKSYIFLRVN